MTRRTLLAVLAALGALLAAAPPAAAEFGFAGFRGALEDQNGFSRQAGAHPDLRLRFDFPQLPVSPPQPDGRLRSLRVNLPPGMVGNPTAGPACSQQLLTAGENGISPRCPASTQVGIARISATAGEDVKIPFPVYNLEAPPGSPGLLGINYEGVTLRIRPSVRGNDFGLSTDTEAISEAITIAALQVTLWGVPADAKNDVDRYVPGEFGGSYGAPSDAPRRPFLTTPTSCPGTALAFSAEATSWQRPDSKVGAQITSDPDGTPFVMERCDRLPFDPSIQLSPESRQSDSPTGLAVRLTVPQSDEPDSLATAHVRRVKVELPDGMSVSPSAASGLAACSPAAIGIGNDSPAACPAASKIGDVSIDTPLLAKPLQGGMYLAAQNDNPFGSLLAVYLVAEGSGVVIKLPGKVDVDETTGRLTATFDNTPQLPFSALDVSFRGGPTAPLASPPRCGTYPVRTEITSWASSVPAVRSQSMTFDRGCEAGFSPAIAAGVSNPAAGASSPFSFTVARQDRSQILSRIDAELPPGLLARIAGVSRCAAPAAAAGTCPESSRVGSTSVLAGPGDAPLALGGRVYLTGPHNGAPFGLSIVVPTRGQTGPFDLGDVVVRAAISVDRRDAHVTVRSDPLPTILRGFPLRLRRVTVDIDRRGFMLNPTNCGTSLGVLGRAFSTEGGFVRSSSPFRLLGCAGLRFDQKLGVRLTGRGTRDGAHPGLRARLKSSTGRVNLRTASVKLPLSTVLDPDNARGLCKPEQRAALRCPASSIVGRAEARSVLPDVLKGPVYFVEGRRRSSTGRVIRTLPKLWVPLRANGVTIDLNADSGVDGEGRLRTTFHHLPDAPISSFVLRINGGRNGILVVSGRGSTCSRPRALDYQLRGHDGRLARRSVNALIDGCRKSARRR